MQSNEKGVTKPNHPKLVSSKFADDLTRDVISKYLDCFQQPHIRCRGRVYLFPFPLRRSGAFAVMIGSVYSNKEGACHQAQPHFRGDAPIFSPFLLWGL
jgi:hypothetical protein